MSNSAEQLTKPRLAARYDGRLSIWAHPIIKLNDMGLSMVY